MNQPPRFNLIDETDYPRLPQTPPQDNSAGLMKPYKVQSGETRGDLRIKGRVIVADTRNVVRLIMGYDPAEF